MTTAELAARLSRPTSKAGRTQREVLALLVEHQGDDALPTSPRFVFYELEQRGLATKPDPEDRRPNKRRSHGWPPGAQDVGDALEHLRDEGVIPWSWITDETRRLDAWAYASTVADYLRDRLAEARINAWGAEPPPLIICESKATAGVLRRPASEYVCPITGIAGQCGGFLITEVAPLLRDNHRRVLYLGDLDRSGEDIEENARRVLERAARRHVGWERLGMLQEQADEGGIEAIWKVDGRDGAGHWAWEVEALGQATVVTLVRRALDDLLPEPLVHVREREREQRERWERLLNDEGA